MLRPARASSMRRRRYSGAYGGCVRGMGNLLLYFSLIPSTKAGPLHSFETPPSGSTEEKGAMEEAMNRVVSQPTEAGLAEERMLGADLVREMVARKERGEGAKRIARELGVDRKTVKRWLRLGRWQPRRSGHRARPIERFTEFIEKRAPEVGWNGVVLHRELMDLGFTGTYQQVQRFLQPYRAKRKWSELGRCGSRPSRASKPRSTMASSRSGPASSRRRSICSCLRWATRGACSRAGIATKDWRRCSTATSARCATSAESHLAVSMIIRALWYWAAARTRCCGIRCSRTSRATTASPRAPASRTGRAPRARSRAG